MKLYFLDGQKYNCAPGRSCSFCTDLGQLPFPITRTAEGLQVGADFRCQSLRENEGQPMAEWSLQLLEQLGQTEIPEVQDPPPAAEAELIARFGYEPLLGIAQFSALKLLLNLPSEADAAFTSGEPLPIPSTPWQGSWGDLQAAQNHEYDSQIERWRSMYLHRRLLQLGRPLRHNLWSLILIPRLLRLTSVLWPHEGQFFTSLQQAEALVGPQGRALDALAAQFDRFLGHNEA